MNERLSLFLDEFSDEVLDPELAEYLVVNEGMTSIKHPLVFDVFYIPAMNKRLNASLRIKKEALFQAHDERDWHLYIWLHERPYRCEALLTVADEMTDTEWWQFVSRVWTDSENVRELASIWEDILRSDRPGREAMMDDDDRAAFAALLESIPVYQGCTMHRDDGWSWTTERATAEWFANRFTTIEDSPPRLRVGFVNKSDVLAYLNRRNESEILVAPELVDVVMDRRLSTISPKRTPNPSTKQKDQ